MTQKQIDAAKELLNLRYYGDKPRLPEYQLREWLPEDKVLEEELSCREMINSIMIYGGDCAEDSYSYRQYLEPYIKGNQWHKILLTKERVHELIEEQRADIAKAQIGFAGYDSEGCSYNYCKFADEI